MIDPATGRIFVVADTWDGSSSSSIRHELYGLSVTTGAVAPGLPVGRGHGRATRPLGAGRWALADWQTLDGGDVDLGSSEPVLLPGGLVFAIGKEGVGYLLSASALGGTAAAPVFRAGVAVGASAAASLSAASSTSRTDGIHALALDAQARTFASLGSWHLTGGAIGPPIDGGGLVWSAGWQDGNLYGLDPRTGNVAFSINLGGFNHFATPAAGGGLR